MDPGTVIVCGLYDEGIRIVEELLETGLHVVVVDQRPDPTLLPALETLDVPCLEADPREGATLRDAGISTALALICVGTDDLQALAVGLLAHELRPGLRIVVHLRNAAVGRALENAGVRVIDTARVAAPSVVESCLFRVTRPLDIAGHRYDVVRTDATADGSLREAYGDLAPLAVVRHGRADTLVAPGRDHVVAAGDEVVLIGPHTDLKAAGLISVRTPMVGARAPRLRRRTNPVVAVLRSLDRRLRWALTALAATMALSVGVLMIGYRETDGTRMSVVDALYFTVETVGTVGFGDFYFRDQQLWLRLWAIGLMLVGATIATVFFALLANALISRAFERALGLRQITDVADHVIVVGLGSVGLAVVEALQDAGVPVVAVDADEQNRFHGQVRDAGVPLVVADATVPKTLESVGLKRARAIAVLTSNDLTNVETGLTARDLLAERWADVPVVLRVFDARTAATIGRTFGFRHVRSTAVLAAPWFVGAALGLEVVGTLYVGDAPLLVARLPIAAGGGLEGLTMVGLDITGRVVAIERSDGTVERSPRSDTRLAAGDVAHLVGPYDQMLTLLRRERGWS